MTSSQTQARSLLDSLLAYSQPSPGQTPPSQDRPVKLGTIDPAYSSGLAKVTFDGETTMSGKGFPWLASYTPSAGDRVLLLPQGRGYVILGKVTTVLGFGPEYALGGGGVYRSPNGNRWQLGVSNAGETTWTPII